MPVDYRDTSSERELVEALFYLEQLALECSAEGRDGLALLIEDHVADVRAVLSRGKQPVQRA